MKNLLFLFLFFSTLTFSHRAQSKIIYKNDPSGGLFADSLGFRYIRAYPTSGHIKIDGRLKEDSWRQACFQDYFLQREPLFGEPATERTMVAVLQDDKNIYFGIKCFDSEPQKIIAKEMRRDAFMDSDDYFEIILDTFHDRRNGYYFVINPNGSKRDATLSDEGKSYNPEWDGIWECAAKKTGDGWFAEVAIPWKTLRFPRADSVTWGVNFARMIRRKNERDYWQLIPRDAGRMGFFRLSQAGTLHGITSMRAGGNVEIEPYLLGGLARDKSTDFHFDHVKNVGVEAKVSLTANMTANLTYNTDFAQVEADQERVNLTRFSLFYPEKRDFFLEGAEIFNFGGSSMGMRYRRGGESLRLFYSRRIGIVNRHQQPILGGAKVLGKIGRYQIGMLNMQTKKFSYEDDDETIFEPAVNFTVFRLRREVLKRSSVGVMFLNKQEIHSDYYNRSGGIDAFFPITDQIIILGALAATSGPNQIEDDVKKNMNHQNFAGTFRFAYDSDLWDFSISHLDIQENFNPEVGFIRRTDIRNTEGEIEYSPRPKSSKLIRQFRYRIRYNYLTNHENRMLESSISPSFSVHFQNSARIYMGFRRQLEYLDYDWEVRPGFLIPTDTYVSNSVFLWARSDESDDISGGLMARYGDYYTGHGLQFSPQFSFKNIRNVRVDLDMSFSHINLPEGTFDTRTMGCRFNYFFSTRLYLKAYLQWNDDRKANDGNRIALANILLRWIYRPGSDFYVVYNEGRLIGPTGQEISNRTMMLKYTYFWRR